MFNTVCCFARFKTKSCKLFRKSHRQPVAAGWAWLGLKGRNFETINLFITTQVVTEAAWEPGLSVVTDANCFTALHCVLSASLQVFCPNSSWLRYLGSSLQSLVETINGPVKILTCPFTLCSHKSLFLSYEFPPERSDKWKIVANIEFILSY